MADSIDIKAAVRIASEHLSELYGEDSKAPALEEVELSDGGSHWSVTLTVAEHNSPSAIEAMTGQDLTPNRKVVRIDAETGQVVSIKTPG